ncbi:MAG TPA: lmo0937 family membrane protein [Pyrinomonadaceae bacterium]|jgi:hypothetical protein
MLWIIAVALVVAWAAGMLFHVKPFIHLLLLIAITLIIVQLVAGRRAV